MHKIERGRPRAVNDLLVLAIRATLNDSGALAHQSAARTSAERLNSRERQTGAPTGPRHHDDRRKARNLLLSRILILVRGRKLVYQNGDLLGRSGRLIMGGC
jgi:hypothetical protein